MKPASMLCLLATWAAALTAQTPPVTILEIDMENTVLYAEDVADPLKRATLPAITALPAGFSSTLKLNITVGDIVSVNGRPVKGLFVQRWGPRLLGAPQFTPGRAIADIGGGCPLEALFMLTQTDGTPIGAIMASGTSWGPLPGAPAGATAFSFAVTGGTGAFLGARGQASRVSATAVRSASMQEDPAYRRLNGGGGQRFAIHLIPMRWPEVNTTATGPAIFHGDFSPVTAAKPAGAGEILILSATGLGPTVPNVDPGKPFPPYPVGQLHLVNSPLEVTVGEKAAEVLNAIGWPGQTNVYRVDFRVPDGTAAGTAAVGLSVAWIKGPEVMFPVR